MDKQLARDVRRELISIGDIVRDEARDVQMPRQQLAGGQAGKDGRANTGALQKSVRTRMRGSSVIVESRRRSKSNYAYGAIYEFNRGRAFLGPALDAKSGEVMQSLDDMLDRLVSANGFGRGGLL